MNAGIIQADYVNTHVKILQGPIIAPVLPAFAWLMTGSIVKVFNYMLWFEGITIRARHAGSFQKYDTSNPWDGS